MAGSQVRKRFERQDESGQDDEQVGGKNRAPARQFHEHTSKWRSRRRCQDDAGAQQTDAARPAFRRHDLAQQRHAIRQRDGTGNRLLNAEKEELGQARGKGRAERRETKIEESPDDEWLAPVTISELAAHRLQCRHGDEI